MFVDRASAAFKDRPDAGRQLADKLLKYEGSDAIVLAVPRGGVPVAAEVAERLRLPLDVIVTRKLPIPHNPEAGYGAVTEDGTIVLNESLVSSLGLSPEQIERHAAAVRAEIARRSLAYRDSAPASRLEGRTAILVDDGLASGFTMIAAVESARRRGARTVVVAAPVASRSAYEKLTPVADEVVCVLVARTSWFAVASFYEHWYDLGDAEVIATLSDWRRRHAASSQSSSG